MVAHGVYHITFWFYFFRSLLHSSTFSSLSNIQALDQQLLRIFPEAPAQIHLLPLRRDCAEPVLSLTHGFLFFQARVYSPGTWSSLSLLCTLLIILGVSVWQVVKEEDGKSPEGNIIHTINMNSPFEEGKNRRNLSHY